MYLYFDKTGKLKELINDEALRQGNYGVNKMFIYVEGKTYDSVDVSYLLPSGLIVGPQNYSAFAQSQIPYDPKRDLRFFKYYTTYNFLVVNLENDINGNSPLDEAGTVHADFSLMLNGNAILTLGELNFNVEVNSVLNQHQVATEEYLSLGNYVYLRSLVNSAVEAWQDYLPLTGGTLTGDLTIDSHDLTASRVFATEYWLSTPDIDIIKLDNSVGDLGELQFGIPGGDYSPTFYGSLGVEMWDGRTKEYPTVKFNYYDSDSEYESTTEEQIATQDWSDARYLKLTGGTIAGPTIFNSSVRFDSTVTSYGYLTLQSGLTVSGSEIHAGSESHSGNATFQKNITISAAVPTAASHATRKDYVDNLIASVKANAYQVVQALPESGEEGIIYLVPVQGEDYYTQYIWEGNDWLDIGDTDIDLSGYLPLTGGSITGNLSVGGNLTIANSKLTNGTYVWTFPSKTGTVATVDDVDTLEGKITNGLITAQKARRDGNGNIIIDTYVRKVDIVDDLTSTATNKPLSANQGRILNDSISELKDLLYEISVSEATYTATSDVFVIPQTIDSNRVLVSPGCVLSKLKGNTASFNQKALELSLTNYLTDRASASFNGGEVSFTSTEQYGQLLMRTTQFDGIFVKGHKYLLRVKAKGTANSSVRLLQTYDGASWASVDGSGLTSSYKTFSLIVTMNADLTSSSYLRIIQDNRTSGFETVFAKELEIFDLTQMVLDSITSVAEFTVKYPKDYYPYNPGTLYPSIVSKIESWGYNQFDGVLEGGGINNSDGQNNNNTANFRTKNYTRAIGGEKYTFEYNRTDLGGYMYVHQYDINKNWIKTNSYIESSAYQLVLENNCYYVRVSWYKSGSGWDANVPTNANVCIHLGTATIGYKPYVGKLGTINLPSAPITLRGVNASQDEISFIEDGQGTYTAKLIRKIAHAKLKDFDWEYNLTYQKFYVTGVSGLPMNTTNIICAKYNTSEPTLSSTTQEDKTIATRSNIAGYLYVVDSAYTDATAFKNHFTDDDYLDYPLATPTEETLATGLTFEQVSMLFEEGGYMQVENTNSDYTHADTELAFAVKRAD